MGIIRIRIDEEACVSSGLTRDTVPWMDAYLDQNGLPFIPGEIIRSALADVMRKAGLDEQGKMIGWENGLSISSARLIGFEALKHALHQVSEPRIKQIHHVASHFSVIRTSKDGNPEHTVRVLKRGLTFQAEIEALPENHLFITKLIGAWKRIGIEPNDGAIEADVDWEASLFAAKPGWNASKDPKQKYNRLSYTIFTRSPLCFYNSFDNNGRTTQYISGKYIYEHIAKCYGIGFNQLERLGTLKCANAYPELEGTRTIPAPCCFALKKLDRNVLCDRISKGKDPSDDDQLINISNSYITSPEALSVKHMSVETRTMYFPASSKYDNMTMMETLMPGQSFKGYIEGTPEQISRIYDILSQRSVIRIGSYSEVEYGECAFRIDSLEQKNRSQPKLLNDFYVNLCSPAILYNRYGLYTCSVEDLVTHLEQILGAKDNLEIIHAYETVSTLERSSIYWKSKHIQVKCFEKGSTFRFRTKDGTAVNTSLLEDSWIGECNNEGFGEVSTGRVMDVYYRRFEDMTTGFPPLFLPYSEKEALVGRELIQGLSEKLLVQAIQTLARVDATEYLQDDSSELVSCKVPEKIIRILKAKYCSYMEDKVLFGMYQDFLAGEFRSRYGKHWGGAFKSIDLSQIPKEGYILAYFRTFMLFKKYIVNDFGLQMEGVEEVPWDEMQECHCFNSEVEYRLVASKHRTNTIELTISAEEEMKMDPELIKRELVWLRREYWDYPDQPKKICIVNYYDYDQCDSLYLVNYRISGIVYE
ncbi:MAG: hypothetical protein U0L09_10420 [Christensenellales bacterium]|nr:hypothetical protein [Christensenellales bacterium]